MKRAALRKLRMKQVLLHRSQWPIRRPKIRACSANGFGVARSARCARFTTGRAGRFGHRGSSGQKMRKNRLKVWTGTYGLAPLGNVLTTTLMLRSYGVDGRTSVAEHSATWA